MTCHHLSKRKQQPKKSYYLCQQYCYCYFQFRQIRGNSDIWRRIKSWLVDYNLFCWQTMCWSTKSLWNNTHSVDPLWHTGECPSAPSVTQQVPPSDWITSYQNRHAAPHGSSWVHRGSSTCLIFSPANRDLSTLGTLPWWYSEPAPISASVPVLCIH